MTDRIAGRVPAASAATAGVALVAAAVAVAAARAARRAAASSARAGESAAAAATRAQALDAVRLERERLARGPRLDAGERDGSAWMVEPDGALRGTVSNVGPATAAIEFAEIVLAGRRRAGRIAGDGPRRLGSTDSTRLEFDGAEPDAAEPFTVVVTFAAEEFRAATAFTLRPTGAGPAGRPQWRQRGRETRTL